jgi:transcriptional regulator with XRE-family HTH domain
MTPNDALRASMRQLRIKRGWTQPQLADRLGMTTAGLGPRALAARLDCTVAWLLGRERESVRLTRAECDRIAAALGTDFAGLLEAGARAIAERRAAS